MKYYTILFILIFYSYSTLICQNIKAPEMVFVKGGSFKMGSNEGYDDEKPVHSVTLKDFYIGKFEITVGQYKEFCKETGAGFPNKPGKDWYDEHTGIREWTWRDNHPIVNVTWYEAEEYCKWLSQVTGELYMLPTEAQWEYAAKGGELTNNFKYAGSNDLNEVGWFDENTYERGTKQVGQLASNELGIYDMSGNAFEWCYDFYGPYSSKNNKDPNGPKKGQHKVIRGGGWYYTEEFCRVTQRDMPKPTLKKFEYGFRVVKIIENN